MGRGQDGRLFMPTGPELYIQAVERQTKAVANLCRAVELLLLAIAAGRAARGVPMIDEQRVEVAAPGLPLAAQPPASIDREQPHDLVASWEYELIGLGAKAKPTHGRAVTVRNLIRDAGWSEPAHLNTEAITKRWAALGRAGRGLKTLHTRLSDLSALCEWLHKQGILPANPCEKVTLPKLPKSQSPNAWRRLLDDEYHAFLAAARADEALPAPDRSGIKRGRPKTGERRFENAIGDLIELGNDTGGRLGQLAMQAGPAGPGLRWRDCHEDNAVERHLFFVDSKNGDTWRMPLTDRAAEILRERRRRAEPFAGPDDFVFPFKVESDQVAAYLLDAGLARRDPRDPKRIITRCPRTNLRTGFHSLRVRFCCRLVLANTPIPVAQKLMQHKTVEMTIGVYTKLRNEELAAGIARLNPGAGYPQDPPEIGRAHV